MKSFHVVRPIGLNVLILTLASTLSAQDFLAEIKAEHNPAKRTELALSFANQSFNNARDFYEKGTIQMGDAQLDNMTDALTECVDTLAVLNKAKFYKKAELNVASLQRRLADMTHGLSVGDRGWAAQTGRKLEQIHDKLLNGVMRK